MTRWLTPDERAAWVGLACVMDRLPALLDAQLRADAGLTHFDYWVLAMLSEADGRTLPMSTLAALTRASLPRLSHVVRRLAERGLLTRATSPDDARVTNATLTEQGWTTVEAAAPGHVAQVRAAVIDALSPEQLGQLEEISQAILTRIAPASRDTVRQVARPEATTNN